jgi:hypothetical protein
MFVNQSLSIYRKKTLLSERSLALYRMALAAVVIYDLYARCVGGDWLRAHYGHKSVYNQAQQIRAEPTHSFSLHHVHGGAAFQWIMFAIHCVVALMVFVGYRCRQFAMPALAALTVSLQRSNSFVCSDGDFLLRSALIWACFLPLVNVWSIDSLLLHRLRRRRRQRDRGGELGANKSIRAASFSHWIAIAFAANVCFSYVSAALAKRDAPQWRDGVALRTAMNLDGYVSAAGVELRERDDGAAMLEWLTHAVVDVQLYTPALLALLGPLPYAGVVARCVGIAALAAAHVAMRLLLNIALHSYVSLAMLLVFVPDALFNSLCCCPSSAASALLSLGERAWRLLRWPFVRGASWRCSVRFHPDDKCDDDNDDNVDDDVEDDDNNNNESNLLQWIRVLLAIGLVVCAASFVAVSLTNRQPHMRVLVPDAAEQQRLAQMAPWLREARAFAGDALERLASLGAHVALSARIAPIEPQVRADGGYYTLAGQLNGTTAARVDLLPCALSSAACNGDNAPPPPLAKSDEPTLFSATLDSERWRSYWESLRPGASKSSSLRCQLLAEYVCVRWNGGNDIGARNSNLTLLNVRIDWIQMRTAVLADSWRPRTHTQLCTYKCGTRLWPE